MRGRKEIQSGTRFGAWTVLHESSVKRRKKYYLCRCDCGNEREVSEYSLRYGDSKSCGCRTRKNSVKPVTVGDRYGEWTVIGEAEARGRQKYHLCRCSCGTEREVADNALKSSLSWSCGCKRGRKREKHIAVGNRFGEWTVVAEAEKRGNQRYHLCRCSCGTEREVADYALKSGRSKSCGCRGKKNPD